ncbi:MAG: hypothetical protein ACYTEI_10555 [Planctomycetota bacterium]|jgi:hypothetical protein
MSPSSEQIQPERLLDAADAVLEAVIEVGKDFDGLYVHPPQLMGSKIQPQCLCEYYVFEVEEATRFLVRLGVLPAEATSA